MDNSQFKRVPVEIRQKIWLMVFEDGVAHDGVIELEIDCHPRKDDNNFKAYGYNYIPKPTNPTRIHPYAIADYGRKSEFPESAHTLTLQSARLAPVGPRNLLALTACCRVMRIEGLDTLFANSTLSFDISTSIPLNISMNHLTPRIEGSLVLVDKFLKTMRFVDKTKKIVFLVINANFGKLFPHLHNHLPIVRSLLPRLTQPPHILLEMPVGDWARCWTCNKHAIGDIDKPGAFSGQMDYFSMDEGKEMRSRKLYRVTHEDKQLHKKPAKRYVYKHKTPAKQFDESDGKIWLRDRPRFDVRLESLDAALEDINTMHGRFGEMWDRHIRERSERTVDRDEDGGRKECCDYRTFAWYSTRMVRELTEDTLMFFPED